MIDIATHSIELSERESALIDALVKDGVYADASEALHDGLRRIERERQGYADKLTSFRAEVRKGFDDLDQGRYTDLDGDEDLEAHFAALRERRLAERAAAR